MNSISHDISLRTYAATRHEMTDVASALKQALGLSMGDSSYKMVSQPYIEYIETSWTGRGERQDFLRFFTEVVRHFRGISLFPYTSAISSLLGAFTRDQLTLMCTYELSSSLDISTLMIGVESRSCDDLFNVMFRKLH